ncbi:MAG TPA: hypothetical protein VG267_17765 [Terracidiphilus sp.]|nr:hypothetical protein [Terracidiphilus sp.]
MSTKPGQLVLTPGPRLRTAMVLAIVADIVQMVVFPLFVEGAASPADDLLDLGMAGALSWLLGWHWEFAPSFLAKLVPGIDLAPLWSLAVANVYRKSKALAAASEQARNAGSQP